MLNSCDMSVFVSRPEASPLMFCRGDADGIRLADRVDREPARAAAREDVEQARGGDLAQECPLVVDDLHVQAARSLVDLEVDTDLPRCKLADDGRRAIELEEQIGRRLRRDLVHPGRQGCGGDSRPLRPLGAAGGLEPLWWAGARPDCL